MWAVARKQAEKITGLLQEIEGLSLKMLSQQQTVLKNDKNIPSSKFGTMKGKHLVNHFSLEILSNCNNFIMF